MPPVEVFPRKDDDLKIQFAIKDQDGAWVTLTGATIVSTLQKPSGTLVTSDTNTVNGSPTTYNLEAVFGKAKMDEEGTYQGQVKITFADTTVRHTTIDRFFVQGNL